MSEGVCSCCGTAPIEIDNCCKKCRNDECDCISEDIQRIIDKRRNETSNSV